MSQRGPHRYDNAANSESKTKRKKQSLKQLERRHDVRRRPMEILVYTFGALTAVAGIVAAVLRSSNHRDSSIWVSCLAVVFVVVGGFSWFQNYLWKRDAESAKTQSEEFLVPGSGAAMQGVTSDSAKAAVANAPQSAIVILMGNIVAWTTSSVFPVVRQKSERKAGHATIPSFMAIEMVNERGGKSVASIGVFGKLSSDGEDTVVLERGDEKLWVSAKIFNKQGIIVCEIVKNQIHLNEDEIFRREKTLSRLKIFNKESRIVLDVDFINPRVVRIMGDLCFRRNFCISVSQDKCIVSGQTLSNFSFDNPSTIFEIP